MPFKLFYLPSYERCLKGLDAAQRHLASLIVMALTDYFHSESIASSTVHVVHLEGRSRRLVFKKLRASIWEAYIEGQLRILTRLEKGAHYLVFAGNHDQVRKFLKES